jgi:hypothetical protein
MTEKEILREFPRLADHGFEVTSPEDISYNCIAFAAGDSTRWWWPGVIQTPLGGYYWPGSDLDATLSVFESVFAALGYEKCDNPEYEPGIEKVAIYTVGREVKHAARQLSDGTWTSKLGALEDIRHNAVDGICCPLYGDVALIMRRVAQGNS